MNKKKILPFEEHPYSIAYHSLAFTMGILQANAIEDITPYLCDRYINCYFFLKPDGNRFITAINDVWMSEGNIIIYERVDLSPDVYKTIYGDCVDDFRKCIDRGGYVEGIYNEECIQGKKAFEKYYYEHEFFLLGYDDEKEHFISAGFLKDSKFQIYTIPYDDMRKSIDTLKAPKICYNAMRYNIEAKFELNISKIIRELADYVNSTTSLSIDRRDRSFGIQAILDMADHFIDTSEKDNYIDFRYTRALMEHKFFMNMRVDYLIKKGYVKDNNYLDAAQSVYKMSEQIHMLALKYKIMPKQHIAGNIRKLIIEMQNIEIDYINGFLFDLKNTLGGAAQ